MERHLELLADAKLKINAVYQAFGRPGDYGYSTKEGKALAALYDLHNEIAEAMAPTTVPGPSDGPGIPPQPFA